MNVSSYRSEFGIAEGDSYSPSRFRSTAVNPGTVSPARGGLVDVLCGSDLADWSSGDEVVPVLGDDGGLLGLSVAKLHATFDGLEKLSNSFALMWNLDVYLLIAFGIDEAVCHAIAVVNILNNVLGLDDALLAEGAAVEIGIQRVCALPAALCVQCKAVHDIELVIARETRDWDGGIADGGRHSGDVSLRCNYTPWRKRGRLYSAVKAAVEGGGVVR